MEALDRARAVNARLALPRLERMLRVYRTWVNVEGVEGGMALTRRVLQCVLEFPELDHHVDFLFDTFRCISTNGKFASKVDLVTLLSTAAILAQGALADKARFVFQLVDLDTEDDIVEAELALVISTCCNGLYKLGLIEEGDSLSELDAMAVAYEAFDFVELEDGDKMTFTMFLKWCVFHPRPKELLERMSCLFSMCDCVRSIQDALEERSKRLVNTDTFLYYNDMHFGSLDERAERVHVVAGPIVGEIESTRVNLILEVDTLATIKCFAFALPQEEATMDMDCSVATQECELRAFNPALLSVIGLSPGTMYLVRFLGVCKADRDRCVALVTTKPRGFTSGSNNELPVLNWRVRLLNHLPPAGKPDRGILRASEASAYQKLARDGYQSTQPTLTVHFGIFLSPIKVSKMLEILTSKTTRRHEDADEQVLRMIRLEYQRVLGKPIIWTLLRTHSNWIMDDNASLLFGGFPEWRNTRRTTWSVAKTHLMRLALPVWQSYVGCLWSNTQNTLRCLELGSGVIFAPITGRFDLQSEDCEAAFTKQISDLMREFPSPSAFLLGTASPLFSHDASRQKKYGNGEKAHCLPLVQELVNLTDQKHQVLLLSFDDAGGYQSLVSFKNATMSIQQLVCGPVVGTHSVTNGQDKDNLRSQTHQIAHQIVHHGALEEYSQYAQITSVEGLRGEPKAEVWGRKVLEETGSPYIFFQAQLLPLQQQHEVHRVLGPIVGCVSSRIARILLEGDAEGEVTCVVVDRLTLKELRVVKRIKTYQPTIFCITELTPGRTYDLSFQGLLNAEPGVFQTPHEDLPAFRLVIMAEDRFLDGRTDECTSSGGVTTESAISYIGNVTDYFFPVDGAFQANVTVHIGSVVALAHDLQQTYHLLAQGQQKLEGLQLSNTVRECVRHHWNTPKNRQLLARGAHWLPRIGVLRALLTANDVPISFIRAVQNILAEYEQVGDQRSHSVSPSRRYLYRLQDTVAVLMIDSLEVILDDEKLTSFVQLPERLLSDSQWSALEFWLTSDYSLHSRIDQADINTVVIMCDIPLISHQNAELTRMWRQNSGGKTDTSDTSVSMAGIGALSWGSYPKDQARLLHLIFRKLQKNSQFHVVFVCCGAISSRDTIIEKSTKLSFQHVMVGPISRSGVSQWQDLSTSNELTFGDEDLSTRYSIQQEAPLGTLNSQQYCALELMAHPLRASSDVKFYTQHRSEARLIIGPIIGRVTPRTARILIELDRPVPNLSCTLIDPATLQRYSTQMTVEAFTPTIVKVEGLQPDTRYSIKFEGLMGIKDAIQGHVVTPARVSLALDWLVVNCNSMASFLDHQPTDSQRQRSPPSSQWPQILAKGLPSFTAQLAGDSSYRNGDFLGGRDDEGQPNYNPWHSIEDEYLSEPLASPQLLLHLGGQVDMSRSFSNEELGGLVIRLATQMEATGFDEDSESFQLLRSKVRYRLQEVYRVAWGIPPMKKLLGYCSNLMLLNEDMDLYFNRSEIRSILSRRENEQIPDNVLDKVVSTLREIAFELWQLYQNQLWTDLAERELKYGGKSSGNKTAFSSTFGINRMIVANVSHEAYEYCKVVEGEAQQSASSSGAVKRSLDEPSTAPTISLYSAPSWKIIDEACETLNSSSAVEHRTAPTKPQNPVQHLVFVTSGDIMAWGGSKHYPALRSEIVKLLEKLFAWKIVNRVQREVAVICVRTNGSSITFEVTDEKISEKITLTCVGSISDARELLHRDQKKTKGGAPTITKGVVIAKGNFSKRFSYRATTNTASYTSASNSTAPGREKQVAEDNDSVNRTTTRCRTFVSYRFITDYRRGFFDETLRFFPPRVVLPKAVLGPVIGRMLLKEAPRQEPEETLVEGDPGDPVKMLFTVPILLEINADARVDCIVTDILANQDIRVMGILTRHHPHVFEIPSLIPERRYVYRFEGIANSEDRRGSFHTPSSSSTPLTFVAVSSNFPEQMEESTDSLWMALNQRVQVSWCGIDLILHLGGQVPMHEAAFECFEWISRELKLRDLSEGDYGEAYIASLRRKVRQRMQQRYHLCWNVPNVRETLAHTSNWFLRSQADVAPFFRNHEVLATKAAQIVLDEAKQIVADYQLSLMLHDDRTASEETAHEDANYQAQKRDTEQLEDIQKRSGSDANSLEQVVENMYPGIGNHDIESSPENVIERSDTAQFIQTGEIGVFMCDMRDTPRDDIVTCNNRLLSPLTQQEHAVIGEKQWQELEKALKKKSTMVFVLCMELPLILTDAKQVDALQEQAAFSGANSTQEERTGRWRLYDRQTVSQHWVTCRRQLEQLLNLLFRWKAKHRGRDVIVLSGGMRVGLETLLQDRDTKLAIRNLTVGPLTARVEPDFENLSLDGIACPTFLGGARDDRFTFAHSIISNKNYLLAHAVVTREQTEKNEVRGKVGGEIKSASIKTEFIAADGNVDATHPVSQHHRFPSWWPKYVPMGKMVFWDDTVIMRAQSDEDMSTLAGYLQDGRDFTAALEVLFEKHQFAEAARMEELRSKHRRRQRGPEELRLSLRAVFAELWKVLPEQLRQRLAYFQDEFVFDFLLGYLAPDLFTDDQVVDEDVERPPLEFAAFSTLCRDFIFNAGVLNLCLNMQQEDEYHTIALQRANARRQAAERETQRIEHERQRAEEEAELARLQQENPEEYSKRKLAEQEIAQKEKLAKAEAARELRKAEKMHDVEEELAIAKEQRKLDKLAESGNDPVEFNRRREMVAARIRKFEERKRHREVEEARRREKKEKKKKEQALQ